MTTIDQPAINQIAPATPPADPPAGPAPLTPPTPPRAVLRVVNELYKGRDHRHHLTITAKGDGEEILCQAWYLSRKAAVRAGREWAKMNGYDITEEA